MDLEAPLKEFWYAAEFSSRLPQDTMVPLEILGKPWVLFRDAQGKAGCIKDECAHRACPLSIGKVSKCNHKADVGARCGERVLLTAAHSFM
jgi:chlorophyllide a oxygenase